MLQVRGRCNRNSSDVESLDEYGSICCKNVMQYFAEMNKVNGPVSWLNNQN